MRRYGAELSVWSKRGAFGVQTIKRAGVHACLSMLFQGTRFPELIASQRKEKFRSFWSTSDCPCERCMSARDAQHERRFNSRIPFDPPFLDSGVDESNLARARLHVKSVAGRQTDLPRPGWTPSVLLGNESKSRCRSQVHGSLHVRRLWIGARVPSCGRAEIHPL